MLFSKPGRSPSLLTVVEHRTSASFFHVYSLLLLLYHLSNTLLMQLYESEQSTRMVFSVDCSSPNPRPTFSQSTCTLTPTNSIRRACVGSGRPANSEYIRHKFIQFHSYSYNYATYLVVGHLFCCQLSHVLQ